MKLKFLIISILFIGCKSSNVVESSLNNSIAYVLPLEVENILKKYLSSEERNETCLELKKAGDVFSLYVNNSLGYSMFK